MCFFKDVSIFLYLLQTILSLSKLDFVQLVVNPPPPLAILFLWVAIYFLDDIYLVYM